MYDYKDTMVLLLYYNVVFAYKMNHKPCFYFDKYFDHIASQNVSLLGINHMNDHMKAWSNKIQLMLLKGFFLAKKVLESYD